MDSRLFGIRLDRELEDFGVPEGLEWGWERVRGSHVYPELFGILGMLISFCGTGFEDFGQSEGPTWIPSFFGIWHFPALTPSMCRLRNIWDIIWDATPIPEMEFPFLQGLKSLWIGLWGPRSVLEMFALHLQKFQDSRTQTLFSRYQWKQNLGK